MSPVPAPPSLSEPIRAAVEDAVAGLLHFCGDDRRLLGRVLKEADDPAARRLRRNPEVEFLRGWLRAVADLHDTREAALVGAFRATR